MTRKISATEFGTALRDGLSANRRVHVEGLGSFWLDGGGECQFEAQPRREIFIAYVQEDAEAALRLYDDLEAAGFDPWLDKKKLMPGQNWVRAVERAILRAEFFMPCFSRRSLLKHGQFQSELKFALQCAREHPLDEVYVVPVRLEECLVPARVAAEWQWVDLFPDWDEGMMRIRRTLEPAGD